MILADSGVVFDKENHTYRLGDKQLWGITGMLSSQLFPEKYDFVPLVEPGFKTGTGSRF